LAIVFPFSKLVLAYTINVGKIIVVLWFFMLLNEVMSQGIENINYYGYYCILQFADIITGKSYINHYSLRLEIL